MGHTTLDYRERPAEAQSASGLTVVLLHGFGADADDLFPLAEVFDAPRRHRWIFPNAPYPITMFGPRSRAWFPRAQAEIEAAATGAYFQKLRRLDPDTLRTSGDEVATFCGDLGFAPERTVLGGFSQGSIVAIEAALHNRLRPAALVVLSGALIAEERWRGEMPPAVAQIPVLQTHGSLDEILPYSEGAALAELFKQSGAELRFHRFEGGHTIPSGITELLPPVLDSVIS